MDVSNKKINLLTSPVPYVSYNAMADSGDLKATEARIRLLDDPAIIALVKELQMWPGPRISSHKSASQFFHKLVFLADIGLKHDDPGIESIAKKIMGSLDENGVPTQSMEIPSSRGGAGTAVGAWALCDAPSVLYALKKLDFEDERLDRAARHLSKLRLGEGHGYGCVVSASLKNWRGPGKKTDPCPYATLLMLKLLVLYDREYQAEILSCAECLLDLWDNSREKHPYIFYAGTDFRKLKLPFIWYDILHVANAISHVEAIRNDIRFLDMMRAINEKRTRAGYIPESIYLPWRSWDFGQKEGVSDWMTYCVAKIERRLSPA